MVEGGPRTHYSVFAAPHLARLVAKGWGLTAPECEFWGRHVHDTYRIAVARRHAWLRVYRHGWRPRAEVEAEVELLRFLRRRGLGVPEPLPRTNGRFVGTLRAAEGPRDAVLFAQVSGTRPAMDVANSRAYGQLAATFHARCDEYPRRLARPTIDLESLAVEPLAQIARFWRHRRRDVADLRSAAREVTRALDTHLLSEAPGFGLCHGDFHFGNVLRDGAGRLALIDFDCAGYGWRAHDVSVFLWSRGWEFTRGAQRDRRAQWAAFVEGYGSVRALSRAELRAARLFVPLHQLWVMGLWIRLREGFGRRWLTDAHFDTHVAFVREWMRRLG